MRLVDDCTWSQRDTTTTCGELIKFSKSMVFFDLHTILSNIFFLNISFYLLFTLPSQKH